MEGLGGPIRVDRPNFETIDPTLEACCRREEESIRRSNALTRTLQKFDVVREKERRRRNLVTTKEFDGCRCCYDPNSDGGEYRALIDLRKQRKQQLEGSIHHENEEEVVSHKGDKSYDSDDDDSSSDDEYDYLLDEDLPGQSEELRAMEDARRAELEMTLFCHEVSANHGYGVHRQMHPSRALRAAGLNRGGSRDPSPAVVLHLFDPDAKSSASLDIYLEQLAQDRAKGTQFMRSGGRSTLLMDAELAGKALPQLAVDKDLPALFAIRDGVVVSVCPRLQGLVDGDGGTGNEIVPDAVYEWLDRSGVLLHEPPLMERMCGIRPEEDALMDYMIKNNKPPPSPPKPRYDCGVPGCEKNYFHEHVGIQNEQQDGRVLSEEQILG